METFKPIEKETRTLTINVSLTGEEYSRVNREATRRDLSKREFCRQAIFFALENLEEMS